MVGQTYSFIEKLRVKKKYRDMQGSALIMFSVAYVKQ